MVDNVRADYEIEQIPAPAFYIVAGKPWLTVCPVHKRSLTYIELIQQKCHWCYPMRASKFLSDGKTKNPCYNHEQDRPFTKEELDSIIETTRRYRKKTNG